MPGWEFRQLASAMVRASAKLKGISTWGHVVTLRGVSFAITAEDESGRGAEAPGYGEDYLRVTLEGTQLFSHSSWQQQGPWQQALPPLVAKELERLQGLQRAADAEAELLRQERAAAAQRAAEHKRQRLLAAWEAAQPGAD